MEEKKQLKMSLSTFLLIIAIIVIIVMACYIYIDKTNSNKEIANLETNATNMQNTIDNLQDKIDSISNTINSNTTKDTTNKISNDEVDKIAKELFEKGSEKIRETEYSDYYNYDSAKPLTEKNINGVKYQKRNVLYSDVEKEYSEIFTGEALKKVLGKRFAEVDGYLYVSYGGATGWNISNIKVSRVSESNNGIEYIVKYNDINEDDSVSEERSCNMTIKLVDGNYRISTTNYCNLD